jgi:hypothetical protein
MMAVKTELKVFLLTAVMIMYDPVLLITMRVVKELYSALVKNPTSPPSGYPVYINRYNNTTIG